MEIHLDTFVKFLISWKKKGYLKIGDVITTLSLSMALVYGPRQNLRIFNVPHKQEVNFEARRVI